MKERKLRQYGKLTQEVPEHFRQTVDRVAPHLADWARPVLEPALEEASRLVTDCVQARLRAAAPAPEQPHETE